MSIVSEPGLVAVNTIVEEAVVVRQNFAKRKRRMPRECGVVIP